MKIPSSLSSTFSFGEYKGRSVASVYSGEPRELIRLFLELVDRSFASIFSKDSYSVPNKPDRVNFYAMQGGWADDEKKVNHHCVGWIVGSLRAGGSCEYNVSPSRIRILVKDEKGKIDPCASECACEIGREFVARCFARVQDNDNKLDFRPAMVSFAGSSEMESRIQYAEGNPNYIYWALRKLDNFYLNSGKESVDILNGLPVFSFGSLKVKTGKIEKDFSFKTRILLGVDFDKADEQTIKNNYDKYSAYLDKLAEQEAQNRELYSDNSYGDDSNNGDDGYYDADDDEENIMRGLASGDSDLFGM